MREGAMLIWGRHSQEREEKSRLQREHAELQVQLEQARDAEAQARAAVATMRLMEESLQAKVRRVLCEWGLGKSASALDGCYRSLSINQRPAVD